MYYAKDNNKIYKQENVISQKRGKVLYETVDGENRR
jgi:hypothetical protein